MMCTNCGRAVNPSNPATYTELAGVVICRRKGCEYLFYEARLRPDKFRVL